ncbi:ABC transporter substrate-binding protein [Azospirillum lipoferum]|uniref:ABC transporter substrate-binding protein n=2 Tax=Azospirillum lipoferum TaxID=193 RepID=A0A5A9GD44_AZOLI|nr:MULTISPECIES: ABC transporter substrate-binding protein [Azospirillum]KAA0592237.1 ABC transporter substrate-binding protein [Azospirillum lipoferum]MDW5536501.1 ABC transporter substrate-binding protein [Azospirillum sp. NL1]
MAKTFCTSLLRWAFPAFFSSLAGLGLGLAPGSAAEAAGYPLTVQNCGMSVTFGKAPARVVAIGQSTTEILLSLGLADRIAGTAVWVGPVLKPFEAQNARIKRLADNDPSFESVVQQEPDLVAAQFEWHIGSNGSVGKREQFAQLGIPTYISPADCVEKDNSGGGDGLRKQMFTMDLVYQEIRDLARIFGVDDRGEALVAALRTREAAAIASVAGGDAKGVPVVFWFSSKEVRGDAFVAGRNGAPAYIVKALGARNVVTTEEEWPLASWERIAAADPAVIVIATMDRRRYAADDPAVKLAFLESDPVTGKLEAVRKKRFVLMDAQSMNPTIRTIDGIEALANGIKAFGLAD